MPISPKEVFAKNLWKILQMNDVTQKELATMVGVSPPTVNDWLKANVYPRIDKIEKIATHFGVSKSDLIENEDFHHKPLPSKNIGASLKIARISKGFTQTELGEKLGVGKTAVAKWEAGKVKNLKRDTLQQLADILELSPLTLMGFPSIMNDNTIVIEKCDFTPASLNNLEKHITCEKNNQKCIVICETDYSLEDFAFIEQFIEYMTNKKLLSQFSDYLKKEK